MVGRKNLTFGKAITGGGMKTPSAETVARFVLESNLIEGISAHQGMPEWDDHWAAAQWVIAHPGRALAYPRRIHSLLMDSTDKLPGEYRHPAGRRTGEVTVDGKLKLPWREVPDAMSALVDRARSYPRRNGFWNADELWPLHYEFEAIHPFLDGNGRTGRLWLNALRQYCGFDWTIVLDAEKWAYYDAIREWERTNVADLLQPKR